MIEPQGQIIVRVGVRRNGVIQINRDPSAGVRHEGRAQIGRAAGEIITARAVQRTPGRRGQVGIPADHRRIGDAVHDKILRR